MIAGYVKSIGTSVATGDVTVKVEVVREQLENAAKLNMERVVVLTETEYAEMSGVVAQCQDEMNAKKDARSAI